jgi:tetratricopeptide (TPR) repeat protein
MAITGFVLSLLWLGGIGSLAGLCLGIVATKRTRQHNQAGRGLAVAALILGIVGLIGSATLVVSLLILGSGLNAGLSGISKGVPNSSASGISGTPKPQASAPAAVGGATPVAVDEAKVAALTGKITSSPTDVASLQELGDIYFAAADYKNAVVWEQRVLDVDAKNQVALLAAGAAQFNLGNAVEAKKQWLVAAGLYPNNAEVHYDLGFLYLSQTPPDTVNMTAEWKKVIAIDPNSNIAKTVATHLK